MARRRNYLGPGTDVNPPGSGSLTDTGVTAGTYGDEYHVGQFTVDTKGRISYAADVQIGEYAAYDQYEAGFSSFFTGDNSTADTVWTLAVGPFAVQVPSVGPLGQLLSIGLHYTIDTASANPTEAAYAYPGFMLNDAGSYTNPANFGPSGYYHLQDHGTDEGVAAWTAPTFSGDGMTTVGGDVLWLIQSTDVGVSSLFPGDPVVNVLILAYCVGDNRGVGAYSYHIRNIGPALQ